MNETKIFGDGDNLILFFKDGQNEVRYTFTKPICSEVNLEQHNFNEIMGLSGGETIEYEMPRPPTSIDINLKCLAGHVKVETCDYGGLLKNMDLFKNTTVSQLFRVINKKLNKRSAKHKVE